MSEILLLRLPRRAESESELASWIICNAAGELVEGLREGPLSEAVSIAAGRRVYVVVPGSDVLQVDVELPRASGAKLLQAVPFALEEQLAEDVESLHFALAQRAQGGRTQVTVVSRTLLDGWLASLDAAGIEPELLIAESSLVPVNPARLIALLDGHDVHASLPDGRRLSLPAEGIGETLAAALAEGGTPGALAVGLDAAAGATPAGPVSVNVFATAGDWSRHGPQFEALRASVGGIKVTVLPNGPLPWFARQAASDEGLVNLLQGAYERRRRASSGDFGRWRLAAALIGALLLLHVGAQAWRLARLAKQERAADAAIVEAVRPVLGADASTRDIRRRIQQQLERVRSGSGDAFMPALAAVAGARASAGGARIAGLGYTREGLELRVVANSPDGLERLRAALQSAGWEAQLQGGTSEGDRYAGRIRLRGAGT